MQLTKFQILAIVATAILIIVEATQTYVEDDLPLIIKGGCKDGKTCPAGYVCGPKENCAKIDDVILGGCKDGKTCPDGYACGPKENCAKIDDVIIGGCEDGKTCPLGYVCGPLKNCAKPKMD